MTRLQKLYWKHGGLCCYCKRKTIFGSGGLRATVEHITPKSLGGSDAPDNLTLACGTCNTRRGSMPVEVFMALMQEFSAGQAMTRKQWKAAKEARMAFLAGHQTVSTGTRERAGFKLKAMGLQGAAIATIGEMIAPRTQNARDLSGGGHQGE